MPLYAPELLVVVYFPTFPHELPIVSPRQAMSTHYSTIYARLEHSRTLYITAKLDAYWVKWRNVGNKKNLEMIDCQSMQFGLLADNKQLIHTG